MRKLTELEWIYLFEKVRIIRERSFKLYLPLLGIYVTSSLVMEFARHRISCLGLDDATRMKFNNKTKDDVVKE